MKSYLVHYTYTVRGRKRTSTLPIEADNKDSAQLRALVVLCGVAKKTNVQITQIKPQAQ
jgi:hypothetical protein